MGDGGIPGDLWGDGTDSWRTSGGGGKLLGGTSGGQGTPGEPLGGISGGADRLLGEGTCGGAGLQLMLSSVLRNLGHEEWTRRGRPGQLKPHVKCFNSAPPPTVATAMLLLLLLPPPPDRAPPEVQGGALFPPFLFLNGF